MLPWLERTWCGRETEFDAGGGGGGGGGENNGGPSYRGRNRRRVSASAAAAAVAAAAAATDGAQPPCAPLPTSADMFTWGADRSPMESAKKDEDDENCAEENKCEKKDNEDVDRNWTELKEMSPLKKEKVEDALSAGILDTAL